MLSETKKSSGFIFTSGSGQGLTNSPMTRLARRTPSQKSGMPGGSTSGSSLGIPSFASPSSSFGTATSFSPFTIALRSVYSGAAPRAHQIRQETQNDNHRCPLRQAFETSDMKKMRCCNRKTVLVCHGLRSSSCSAEQGGNPGETRLHHRSTCMQFSVHRWCISYHRLHCTFPARP